MKEFLRTYEIFTKRNIRRGEDALVLLEIIKEIPPGHVEWLMENQYLADILASRAKCSLSHCEAFLSEFGEYMRLMKAAQPLQYGG